MTYFLGAFVVVGVAILAWLLVTSQESGWRCPACRRRIAAGVTPPAFCPHCGALRAWGDGVRHPLEVESHPSIPERARARMKEILADERLGDALPLGTFPTARIVAFVPEGTSLRDAHPTWRPDVVPETRGLAPFPRQHASAVVPGNTYRVEVDCVDRDRPTGGMSSQFGYTGVFVSLLVSLDDGRIWDARADGAY
jgi:hypothetical protein